MGHETKPETSDKHDVFDAFHRVFDQLPLEGCQLKPNVHQYLEREFYNHDPDYLQFVAPEGKVFEMTGDFIVTTRSNNPNLQLCSGYFNSPSLQAKEGINHRDEDEDEDYPFSLFLYPHQSFYGRRLSVSINNHRFGSSDEIQDFQSDSPIIEILIEGSTDAFAEDLTSIPIYIEQSQGSNVHNKYYLDLRLEKIYWGFDVAYGKLGEMKISQVDDNRLKPEFKPILARKDAYFDRLWVPNTWTFESERKYCSWHGVELSEEAYLRLMRRNRLLGMQHGDDPLREWVIIREGADGYLPNMDELAEYIELDKATPKKSNDEEYVIEATKIGQKYQLYMGGLAVVSIVAPITLEQIVQKYAGPGWYQRELNEQLGHNFDHDKDDIEF